MLRLVHHTFAVIWRDRIPLFWPIWMAITAAAIVVTVWVLRRQGTGRDSEVRPPANRHFSTSKTKLTLVLLLLFLGCYMAGSLVRENFTYYDNSLFTLGTLTGQNIPVFIWPQLGRFFPLCDQEYNVLRHVTHSVAGYHSLRLLEILLLSLMLLFLDNRLSIPARAVLIVVALIMPSIVISFTGLIYPEANLIFALACLVWCVKKFQDNLRTVWAIGAVISAQFILYYKETAFLLISFFGMSRVILRCWDAGSGSWNFGRIRDKESRLDLCLAALSIPFLLYYLAAMFPNFRTGYEQNFKLPVGEVLSAYIRVDLLAWVLVATVMARFTLVFKRKLNPSPLWDGIAIGAVAYMFGYIALRMHAAYYLAPVDLVAVLYLGHLLFACWNSWGHAAKAWAVGTAAIIILQAVGLSAFRMYERTNVIEAKVKMAQLIKQHVADSPQNCKGLFFPFASATHVMEFGAFLTYSGVPVERLAANNVVVPGLMLIGANVHKLGPCVGGKPLQCRPGTAPESGDIVVVLPDDRVSDQQGRVEPATVLFSYEPTPMIPKWLRPWVSHLHVVSPEFFRDPLPAHFLQASLAVQP